MNEYIFYTPEGYTTSPHGSMRVENCQMLGIAQGNNKYEAKCNFLKENPWIIEAGFNPTKIIIRQLAAE